MQRKNKFGNKYSVTLVWPWIKKLSQLIIKNSLFCTRLDINWGNFLYLEAFKPFGYYGYRNRSISFTLAIADTVRCNDSELHVDASARCSTCWRPLRLCEFLFTASLFLHRPFSRWSLWWSVGFVFGQFQMYLRQIVHFHVDAAIWTTKLNAGSVVSLRRHQLMTVCRVEMN